MPSINLANVNVTIQQFQEISSGKYNAGEVRLTSEHSLGKVNDHVHSRGKNVVPIPHAEVLVVKDAFVKALQQNGVAADEINRVRRELGLAPDGTTDTSLATRSIRPLTRQLVRSILDRNANTINGHAGAGTIRSHDEMFARYSAEERAGFARTRRETNLAMLQTRKTLPDRGISDAQAVLAGDVHYGSPETRQRLISTAEQQKAAILARSQGNPSDAPDATLRYQRNGGGPDITFSLGMSEKDYVRKLDDMLVLLKSNRQPGAATLAARNEFRSLNGPAAQSTWVAGLPADPNGGFKARTIAIGLLRDSGVDDWETLSLVNRISDFAAISLVSGLVNHPDGLRGDALRQSPLLTAFANQVEPQPVPAERQAYVPALSPDEANANVLAALNNRVECVPTQEAATIQAGVRRELLARFGADIYRANVPFSSLATPSHVEHSNSHFGFRGEKVADLGEILA